MNKVLIVLGLLLLFYFHAEACVIQNAKKIQIGAHKGIQGYCSNNRLRISCEYKDYEIACDGPGGGYSGYDLDAIIYSACGCSVQEERGKQLKKIMEDYSTCVISIQ